MVVFEGGLDALALAEIEARENTIYVSTGGGFGPRTEAALLKLAEGRQVLSGFDNDAAGDALHRQVTELLPGATRLAPPLRVEGATMRCKDWLDVLEASNAARSRAIPSTGPGTIGDGASETGQSIEAPRGQASASEMEAPSGSAPVPPHADEPETPEFG
jgi:5S rRNA maturation endonuclease (ribonuclease M5)